MLSYNDIINFTIYCGRPCEQDFTAHKLCCRMHHIALIMILRGEY